MKPMNFSLEQLDCYHIIGKGKLGTVYLLDENLCVKVNQNKENNLKEVELYNKYGSSPLFPKLYQYGNNYIIMEYIQGKSLSKFLVEGNSLDNKWLKGLVDMFEEGYKIGLSLNPKPRHIILNPENEVRLVDLEDMVKFSASKPIWLLSRLKKFGQKQNFIDYVKTNNKDIYNRWKQGKQEYKQEDY